MVAHGSPITAQAIATGDEEVTALALAKRAGFYPETFALRAWPVEPSLEDGAAMQLGDVVFTVFAIPGHRAGHVSLLMASRHGSAFCGGDLVAHGGRLLMRNIPDRGIQEHAASAFKVEHLVCDAFLPGHGARSLDDAARHPRAAASAFRRLPLPPNAL